MQPEDITRLRDDLVRGRITVEDVVQLANGLLENNELEKAFPVALLLTEAPGASGHTWITAGMVALALSKKDEAYSIFEQVVKQDPAHFDANYNLVLLELEKGQAGAAEERLSCLMSAYPDDASLYNDMAVICSDRGDTAQAIANWEKALLLDPNLSLARNNAMELCLENNLVLEGKHLLLLNAKTSGVTSKSVREIEDWARRLSQRRVSTDNIVTECEQPCLAGKKIAVFAGIDTFVRDIVDFLSASNEVKVFTGGTIDDLHRCMSWADLAWFEWCDNFLIEATRLPKTCPIICRLHSYEAFSDMPARVDWSKVDLLIFVNESVREIVRRQYSPTTPSIVIHNAVDCVRFVIPPSKIYGKKIASVGYINYKKNPSLLLYCFKKIHKYDPEYSLHIAGEHQDSRIQLYFDHFLRENQLPVYFDGWIDDMPAWYADKDFVISTSLFESFHYSVAEGMACGLMPLIHNWYGASHLYPRQFLFNDPDDCLELIKRFEGEDRAKLAEGNRRFVEDRYCLPDKLQSIADELGKLVPASSKPEPVKM